MLRTLFATLTAAVALVGVNAAQAGTHWSIGINVPAAGVVVSNGVRYVEPAPVYYAPPPPVYYAPAPRYVERQVYYAPPPPPRIVYETTYRDRRWDDRRDDRWDRRHDRHDHRWDRRDDYGPRR